MLTPPGAAPAESEISSAERVDAPRERSLLGRALARISQIQSDNDDAVVIEAAPPVPLRSLLRTFWPFARPYRHWLWLALVLAAISPAISVATIWLFKLVTDDVLVPHNLKLFPVLVAAYLGLTLGGGLISFVDDYASAWVSENFLLDVRTALFKHLTRLSPFFFEQRPLGDVMSRLTSDISTIETLLIDSAASLVSYIIQLVFITAALFYLRWDLALIALVAAPVFWYTGAHFSKRIKTTSREQRRRSGSLTAVAQESLTNIPLVQAYGREQREADRFMRQNIARLMAKMAGTRLTALFTPVVDLIEMSGVLVVLGAGTWELSQGRLTLGGLLAFVAYLSQVYSPIQGLARLSNSLYSASASAERVMELFAQKPAVTEMPGAYHLARAVGELQLRNVTYRYPEAQRNALIDVSLTVAPGEVVAVVGPSGAGKSTLVRLLLRFADPAKGSVTLDGHDLRGLQLRSLRDNIAVVLQDTLVFDGTIRENILYGSPDASEEQMLAAAKLADVHEFVSDLPRGYDTVVGQQGKRLSGGQRQRLAIARAFIRNAPVLILDEPTMGLDAQAEQRVVEPLRRLMQGRTTLVISHSFLTIQEATRVVMLNDGRVVDQGTHQELLGRSLLYANLYQAAQGHPPEAPDDRVIPFPGVAAEERPRALSQTAP